MENGELSGPAVGIIKVASWKWQVASFGTALANYNVGEGLDPPAVDVWLCLPSKAGGPRVSVVGGSSSQSDDFTKGEKFIKIVPKVRLKKRNKMDIKEALPVNQKLKELAKNGRKHQTPEERKVWYDYLNKVTPRFHRQRVIGNYIVDFYCPKLRIVIEIDGYQHFYEENREYDQKRTEYLESLGFYVLRFDNTEVNKDFEQVKFEIKEFCENRAKEFALNDYNFIVEG